MTTSPLNASIPNEPHTSALQTLIETSLPPNLTSSHSSRHHAVSLQVLHNLQYQHEWTSLQIHTHAPLPSSSIPKLLPRPIISGLPPQRFYIHPDEQIDMLKRGIKEKDVVMEREWVLPACLMEKWTLRRFAHVFNGLQQCPLNEEAGEVEQRGQSWRWGKEMKKVKRVLLAVVGDDSTIVYYIVHDGIVKPRQN